MFFSYLLLNMNLSYRHGYEVQLTLVPCTMALIPSNYMEKKTKKIPKQTKSGNWEGTGDDFFCCFTDTGKKSCLYGGGKWEDCCHIIPKSHTAVLEALLRHLPAPQLWPGQQESLCETQRGSVATAVPWLRAGCPAKATAPEQGRDKTGTLCPAAEGRSFLPRAEQAQSDPRSLTWGSTRQSGMGCSQ